MTAVLLPLIDVSLIGFWGALFVVLGLLVRGNR